MSSSTSKKIITVFGATGNQGGSVISTLLSHPTLSAQYSIRAITRDPSKASAQSLAAKGDIELMRADLLDPSSLAAAIAGSHAVFAVTNYWETMSAATEISQGRNIVDACIASRVTHLIWSSLPDVTGLTASALKHVEHFDSKAAVSAYAEQRKRDTAMRVTHVMPAFFMSNIRPSIRRPATGAAPPTLALPLHPHSLVPLLDVRADTGKFVCGALLLGPAADGARVQAASDWRSVADIVAAISHHRPVAAKGDTVLFKELPPDVWMRDCLPPSIPDHAKTEMVENYVLIRDYAYYGPGSEKLQAQRGDRFIEALAAAGGGGENVRLTRWEDYVAKDGEWDFA